MDQRDIENDSASAATVTAPAAACANAATAGSEAATAPLQAVATDAAAKTEPASIESSASAQATASSEDATLAHTAEGDACKGWNWTAISPGNRITLLAASLVLAAALGATAGVLAGYHLAPSASAPAVAPATTNLAEIQALKENVVQARVELATLKVSVDVGNRNASTQFTRMGERIDRLDRVQAEAAAKLSKAIDPLDRLARDGGQKDTTGSVAQSNSPVASEASSAMDRWIVRDVRRGAALLEGRMGLIEVVRGDVVPGFGRVAAIGRHDGRWIVITTKGLITSTR